MPSGIEIYDGSGNLRISYTDRLFKFLGVAQVGDPFTGTQASGQIVNSIFSAYPGNIPFAFVISGEIDVDGNGCRFAFSGNILTWTFPNANSSQSWTRPGTIFTYGIY